VKNVLIIFIALSIFACQEDKLKNDILPPATMSNILIDIHIAEAKVNHIGIGNRDSSSATYVAMENQILKKHKVAKKKYIKSFRYYNSRPKEMDEIYTAVIDSLNVRQKLLKMD
jgi:hypothetical protein